MLQRKRIGILGGTFDPIHYGHLLIAQSAAEEFLLDEVIFLPTGKSPHKSASQVTDPDIRCEMVQIAIESNPKFSISKIEAKSSEVNYTCLTLQKFHQIYQNAQLYFIMGEDALDDFLDWKKPDEICRLASVLVAVRNDIGTELKGKIDRIRKLLSSDMYMLHAPNFSISSREIRERICTGKSIQYMLPDGVEAFIQTHSLYKEQEVNKHDGAAKTNQ